MNELLGDVNDLGNLSCERSKEKQVVVKEKITKYDMAVLPIWFGKRNIDESDWDSFSTALEIYRKFTYYKPYTFCDAGEIQEPYPDLVPFVQDLTDNLDEIQEPLAIFIIATTRTGDHPWFVKFPRLLDEYRRRKKWQIRYFYLFNYYGRLFCTEPRKVFFISRD